MKLFEMVMITLQIRSIAAKKYSSSEESIENLLYYQDCRHKTTTTTSAPKPRILPQPMRGVGQPSGCACPRMCCSMCCDCGNQQLLGREMQPLQESMQPIQPRIAVEPQVASRTRKKKFKNVQMPFGGLQARRDLGFTREKIKSLISQDEDIRKILKDLVRVTMQKVDLLEMMNANRGNIKTESNSADDYE